ncbi:MAG TPA: NADH-quinone oxidoreductase subunit J [Ktedonobacterales bacterium]
MSGETLAFFALAAVAIFSGLGVILFRNAVYCMLSLILNLLSLAFFFLLLQSIFVATIQVLVYAGAVMVLFLFVVTMLTPGSGAAPTRDRIRWQWFAGLGLGVILAGALIYAVQMGAVAQDVCARTTGECLAKTVAANGSTETFGLALFNGYALPFELTSVLLVVAVIGAVLLGRRWRREDLAGRDASHGQR